jgi:hypothetical protein
MPTTQKRFFLIRSMLMFGLISWSLNAAFFPLDLRPYVNRGFADRIAGDKKGGWSDQGPDNDMSGIDCSRRNFEGVRFKLIDAEQNDDKAVLVFDSHRLKTGLKKLDLDLSNEAINGKFLYLLHTSCWNNHPLNTGLGKITIRFENGDVDQREIRAGIDLADWWNPAGCPNAYPVVKKKNKNAEVGFYFSKINFSSTTRNIASIAFESYGNTMWIVIAATVSDRDFPVRNSNLIMTENQNWKKVDMSDVKIQKDSALDLSRLFKMEPAGIHGRTIINKAGKLAFEDEENKAVRMQGFNGFFSLKRDFNAVAPEKRPAYFKLFAELVTRQGYNIVRPLALDSWIMEGAEADCVPSPEKLDMADRLFYELKQHGVYLYLSIGAYRLGFQEGKEAFRLRNDLKLRMYLGDEELRSKWERMARVLLHHVNPYTGLAWKDDPAIACVEFYNEQEIGLFQFHRIDAATTDMFNQKWRRWLLLNYGDIESIAKKWDHPGLTLDQISVSRRGLNETGQSLDDLSLFLCHITREQIKWYEQTVRKLGYSGLVSQFNVRKSMFLNSIRHEFVPVISMNSYFNHPSQMFRPGSRCGQNSSVASAGSYWCSTNATRFADRPFFVTEHNHAFWNQYEHEDGILFAAYSAFQGFDSVIIHEDSVRLDITKGIHTFGVAASPVSRANEFIATCLFRRGDIKPARHHVALCVPSSYMNQPKTRTPAVNSEQSKIGLMTGFSLSFPDFPKPHSVAHSSTVDMKIMPGSGSEIISGEWASTVKKSSQDSFSLATFAKQLKQAGILGPDNLSAPANGVYHSDTGEIVMRAKESLIKVVTPRTEAISMLADRSETLQNLQVHSSTTHATIATCSVDGNELFNSKRIVLVYNTEVANSGMELSRNRVVLRKRGQLPILMKCGVLNLSLQNAHAARMQVFALGINGQRNEPLMVKRSENRLDVVLDTAKLKNGPTPFFELAVE